MKGVLNQGIENIPFQESYNIRKIVQYLLLKSEGLLTWLWIVCFLRIDVLNVNFKKPLICPRETFSKWAILLQMAMCPVDRYHLQWFFLLPLKSRGFLRSSIWCCQIFRYTRDFTHTGSFCPMEFRFHSLLSVFLTNLCKFFVWLASCVSWEFLQCIRN